MSLRAARTTTGPGELPKVSVALLRPEPSVGLVMFDSEALPLTTDQFTVTPGSGEPLSVATATSGSGRVEPTPPLWLSPESEGLISIFDTAVRV
jgi:hypothetical protein